jgi:antitoxin CptB
MAPTLVTSCKTLPPEGANFSRGGPVFSNSGEAKNCTAPCQDSEDLIGERQLSRLKWSCRRGLLENDLFIERFFKRFESGLTVRQARALSALMELSDNDLLDLHLARKSLDDLDGAVPDVALNHDDVREVLSMLRKIP